MFRKIIPVQVFEDFEKSTKADPKSTESKNEPIKAQPSYSKELITKFEEYSDQEKKKQDLIKEYIFTNSKNFKEKLKVKIALESLAKQLDATKFELLRLLNIEEGDEIKI